MEFWLWMFGAYTAGLITTLLVLGLFGMNDDCDSRDLDIEDQDAEFLAGKKKVQ